MVAPIKTAGTAAVRRKQMMAMVGAIFIILGIAAVAAFFGAGSPNMPAPKGKQEDVLKQHFGTQEEAVPEREIWRTREGARVTGVEDRVVGLESQLKRLQEGIQTEAERRKVMEDSQFTREGLLQKQPVAQVSPPPFDGAPSKQAAMHLPVEGAAGRNGPPAGFPEEISVPGIVRVEVSPEGKTPGASTVPANGADVKKGGRQNSENYLPTGTFMRAVSLGGLDAPTGGQIQQNPHPIIFKVLDYATLPNKFQADYKECFVTGNGYGDLSSERAYIRLDRLSCIGEDGGALDVSVKGYVAGEDGKAGMRGRLVSKQGALLANALLSGIASGIGQAFVQESTTVSTSPLGNTTTIDPNKALQAGLGAGVGTALQKLAAYYIAVAEKMFPVIEIDSAREVDIVITQGISIER